MQAQSSKPLKSFSLRRKSPFLDSLVSVTQSTVFPRHHIHREGMLQDPPARSKNVMVLSKNSPTWSANPKGVMDSPMKGILSPRSSQLPKKNLKMNADVLILKTPNMNAFSEKKPDVSVTYDRSIFGQSDPKTLLKETSSRGSKDMSVQPFLSVSKTVKGIRYKSSKHGGTEESPKLTQPDKRSDTIGTREVRTPKIVGYTRPTVDVSAPSELPSRKLSPINSPEKARENESGTKHASRQIIRPVHDGLKPSKFANESPAVVKQAETPISEIDNKPSKQSRPASKNSDYFVRYLKRSFPQGERLPDDYHKLAEEAYQYIVKNHMMLQVIKVQSVIDRPAPITIQRKYPNRKLLILDLDETLIHCSVNLREHQLFDNQIVVKTDEGLLVPALLNIRPHVDQFLQKMSENFEVVLFTASAKYYASKMLRYIDPSKSYFSHVFYRDSCCKTTNGKLVKDLTIFVNVPLKDMILVDNNTYCMLPQPTCGVPILNFYHDKADEELLRIQSFLLELKDAHDHREVLKNVFRLPELLSCRAPEDYLRHFL